MLILGQKGANLDQKGPKMGRTRFFLVLSLGYIITSTPSDCPPQQSTYITRFFLYKQPGCLGLTRKICPKVKQLAKQLLRVKFKKHFQRTKK